MHYLSCFFVFFVAIQSFGQEPSTVTDKTRGEIALWQIALDQKLFSPGCIDGKLGSRTQLAIVAWQEANDLKPDGKVGPMTKASLGMDETFAATAFAEYAVTAEDLASIGRAPESWRERAKQSTMPYETILELVAEKSHATQDFIRTLNPAVDWNNVAQASSLRVPNVSAPTDFPAAAKVRISLSKKIIAAFDGSDKIVALFPCSIGRDKARVPVGELRVIAFAPRPNYTFDPAVFPESAEAREIQGKLIIPPGPNNPVGSMWISLGRPEGDLQPLSGYGIHGTPKPEDIGKTESHGCFRLANWNAERLAKMISAGTPVFVEAE